MIFAATANAGKEKVVNELIETLRGMADMLDGPQNAGNLVVPSIVRRFREAADTLERLEAENAALREQFADKEIELQAMRNAANQYKRWFYGVIAERDALRKQIAELKNYKQIVEVKDKMIDEREDILANKCNIIFVQTKELDALHEQLDDAKRQLRQRDAMNTEQAKCIDRLIAERDAALNDLRGKCSVCVHYTLNHREGVCAHSCREYMSDVIACSDLWQWRGLQKEDNGNDE